ncbi:Neuroblast differentiation-associated protein [Cordyceps militaris CM01]|uniref:Neuroblast differentiation-associated protein n=1 Tax=Cordyceps militaris (strain CM01) TaxID=983644 RepID=G3JKW2_CORMM|nr:Neuroblast differentiation-associated protein [Cordyceps militaris CM01]EGX90336.1 Neuroblast differentiation-associated protein [Cordyceps militaris CM01]
MAEETPDLFDYQDLGHRFQAEIQARFLPLCSEEEKSHVTTYLMPMVKFVASTVAPSRHNLVKGPVPSGCPETLRWAVACFVFGTDRIMASLRFGDWVRANQELLEKFRLEKGACLPMPKSPSRTSLVGEKRRTSGAHTGAGEEEDDEERSKRRKMNPINSQSLHRQIALESSEAEMIARESTVASREAEMKIRESTVASREAEMKIREDTLQSRDIELSNVKSALDDRQADLGIRTTALESREVELQKRADILQSRDIELSNVKSALDNREADLGTRAAALESSEADLQKRGIALQSSAAELDECARHLQSRKTALDSTKVLLDKREAEMQSRETTLANLETSLNTRADGSGTPEANLGHRGAACDAQLESGQKQERHESEAITLAQPSNPLVDDYISSYDECYDRAILGINAIRVLMDDAVGGIQNEKYRRGLEEEFKEAGHSLTSATNRGWKIFRLLAGK